jgi:hypothetical protein
MCVSTVGLRIVGLCGLSLGVVPSILDPALCSVAAVLGAAECTRLGLRRGLEFEGGALEGACDGRMCDPLTQRAEPASSLSRTALPTVQGGKFFH